LLILIVSCFEG